jgi:hypothetical protein
MFKYLRPLAICVGVIIPSWMIQLSRNIMGACGVLAAVPLGLVFGSLAIREASRPGGLRALLWGICWNIPIALGPWLVLWAIVKFGLLKHL